MGRWMGIGGAVVGAGVAALLWVAAVRGAEAGGPWVSVGRDGRLEYREDGRGNRVPDFSNCGYGGGGVELPRAAVKVTVGPGEGKGDDTARLQEAIDQVSAMPVGGDGLRGAVLIKRGRYVIAGTLHVRASGVVIRGEGQGENGTVLFAAGDKERDVIEVKGERAARGVAGSRVEVADEYVPVGARTFGVKDGSRFKTGEAVLVTRVGNKEWIHEIGMDRIQGRPGNESSTKQWGPFELKFERVVTGVEGNKITVDAPIVCAIETRWGGGYVERADDEGRIENCGVENLSGDSAYDPSVTKELKEGGKTQKYAADEKHARYLVHFANVKNAWLRDVTATHFYNGPVNVIGGAKWVTVQDCRSTDPVSEITGGRRYPYAIQGGQLVLVQRCYSRDDRHAFVVGSHVEGPNAFVECVSERPHATSEPHHRWSVGGLYDNVHANIAFQDRQWMGSGHGWAGANYVAWNCEGSLVCQMPPTAQNWAIGQVGKREPGAFERAAGYWESYGRHVEPKSLYRAQLKERLGARASAGSVKESKALGVEVGDASLRVALGSDAKVISIEAAGHRAMARLWDGLGDRVEGHLIDWQGGKGIEVSSDQGRQVVWVEAGSPFVRTKVWVKNAGAGERVVKDVVPLTVEAEVGEGWRWFGSDGLGKDGDAGKTSYTFLAIAEPKTRQGIVGGWLTQERASGIVVGARQGTKATVAARDEYGRLPIAAGEAAEGEVFALGLFEDARVGLEKLADAVAGANHIKLREPMCGYSTWYHAHALDERRMAELSDWCKANGLDQYGLNFLQIDDQWQVQRRDFTANKTGEGATYPHGMKLTAENIARNGFVPGLWLTPFGWQGREFQDEKPSPNNTVLKDHPDWFVKQPDGSIYWVKWAGDSLDMSNPQAREFLQGVIHRMVDEWGYRLLKIDGLWAGMAVKILYPSPEYREDGIGEAVFYDRKKTNVEVYRDGLRLVREASGGQNKTFILGCNIAQNMRTMGASMGLVDSMRVGPDIKADWNAVVRCAKPAGWLYFWNGRVWWNDPDCLMLREPLTVDMGRAWGSFIAISGQLHLVSEWLPGLPKERLETYKRTVPNHGLTSVRPIDLFENEMPRVWHLTKGEGEERRDVVGLFNWAAPAGAATKPVRGTGQEEPAGDARKSAVVGGVVRLRVDPKELGMPAGRYAAFDFWENKFLAPVEGPTEFDVRPGSCRVISLVRVADRPVVVSTSRHVTQGIVEMSDVRWDEAAGVLRGTSKIVGGDPYELRVDTAGWKLREAKASDGGAASVPKADGRNQRVEIASDQTRAVNWELRFEK